MADDDRISIPPLPKASEYSVNLGAYLCVVCGGAIPTARKSTQYCSPYCEKPTHPRACMGGAVAQSSAGRTASVEADSPHAIVIGEVTSGTLGAVNELLVAAHLMSRGVHVYRSMSPASPCDMVIVLDRHPLRLEVTTGRRKPKGGYSWAAHDASRYDILAAVLGTGEILYITSELPEYLERAFRATVGIPGGYKAARSASAPEAISVQPQA